jgi:hypothetical protein
MDIQSVYSSKQSVNEAVIELKEKITINEPRLVVFFASSIYKPDEVAAEVKAAFSGADVLGCSTAGEIVSGKMLTNSIVAMAFDKEASGDVKIEVIENIKENSDPQKALESFENHFGKKLSEMDYKKYLGLALIDGCSFAEEALMEKLGTKTNVFFVGGSAGDDLKFEKTYIYVNGKAYANAAALALLKPGTKFDILKTQSFKALGKKLIATKVNEAAREIIEFNGKPAAEVYAEAVGKPVNEIESVFMSRPLGVMIGDEPYVRSPQQSDSKTIKFYCNVAEGTELTILHSEDIIKDTRDDISKKVRSFGRVSGLLNFNCILRTLELQNKNLTEEYGKVFESIPTVGFSTYGEEYIGHINQTSVIVLFQ